MKENEIDYKKLYEEEHEKYESAISTAKILRDNSDDKICRDKIEAIFPKLKESEDERIRKAIKLLVEMKENDSIGLESVYGASYRDMIVWLEKQGEQKPTTTTPKFKVGDWVINDHGFVMQIIDVQDSRYVYMYDGKELSATIEQMEDSCHLWSIGDANDGDVLVYKNEIFMIKSYTLWHKIVYHCCYDREDLCTHSIYDCWKKEDFDKVHPATREQCDLLFQKMKESGYEWDAEKKELRKIESDSSCNEEDDKVFKDIYKDLHTYYTVKANMLGYDKYKKEYTKKWENAKKWLEEHKEHWKPTREQLFHIQGIIEECGYSQDWLESLYNDLKKL